MQEWSLTIGEIKIVICCYNKTLIGRSHSERGKICQDDSRSFRLSDGWGVAAVADGVGSCLYSDVASEIAIESIYNHISDCDLQRSQKDEIIELLKQSYELAFENIVKRSSSDDNELSEYDTTLSVAIFDGSRVYYGHSGDGGIIGLSDNGKYEKITKPQKGSDGISVVPLRFKEFWEFGTYDDISSVLVATDGVYDNFFPSLLHNEDEMIYVSLIAYFIDNNQMQISKETEVQIGEEIEQYLNGDTCSITDDMSVAVLINDEKYPKRQPDQYYDEPDWDMLREKINKYLYPKIEEKEIEKDVTEIIILPDNSEDYNRIEEIIDDENKEMDEVQKRIDD